jgi:predicted O-methyltransferase YrrM
MSTLKRILKAITPHALVEMRRAAVAARSQKAALALRSAFHAERRRLIASVEDAQVGAAIRGDDYERVIAFLRGGGLSDRDLREGSMPAESLEFIRERAISQLDASRPLRALHIGNFVGVSLAFLAAALVRRHPESLVVSIDPNLIHRGITNPQAHVSALLSACGLQRNNLIVAGYSGRKSVSNDGTVFEGYDPAKEFSNEFACEESLRNIGQLCPRSFDFVCHDGNHEATYLLNEIKQVLPLLRKGGFVVLDDVNAWWAEIRDVFLNLSSLGLEPVGTDGRVGIARLLSEYAGTAAGA